MNLTASLTVLAALAWVGAPPSCGGSSRAPEPGSSSQAAALEGPPCRFDAPKGWETLPPPPGALQVAEERFDRQNVVLRSRLELRAPVTGTLEQGIERAKLEEVEALSARPAFELVRDDALVGAALNGHLLVYRYQVSPEGPVALRYRAVFTTGFRTVHVVGDSQATVIDALELPYREAGLHEMWLRPALFSVQCSR